MFFVVMQLYFMSGNFLLIFPAHNFFGLVVQVFPLAVEVLCD